MKSISFFNLNKKANVTIYGIMLALTIIILALALAGPIKESTDSARNATDGDTIGMDCDNSSISDFQKAACVATDINLFYFVGGLLFLAGVIISARIIFS